MDLMRNLMNKEKFTVKKNGIFRHHGCKYFCGSLSTERERILSNVACLRNENETKSLMRREARIKFAICRHMRLPLACSIIQRRKKNRKGRKTVASCAKKKWQILLTHAFAVGRVWVLLATSDRKTIVDEKIKRTSTKSKKKNRSHLGPEGQDKRHVRNSLCKSFLWYFSNTWTEALHC